ncbi:hypothetical protein FS842_009700 [Serendipita sp. 407]|nr:hypothetical protein FS842_009700 [Serendipita sp. 407]
MSSTRLMPKTTTPRPPLPTKWNTYLANLERNPVVKFQPIRKDGAVVYVGRIKVEVPPDEHNIPQKAYVLRRYDTGCISLTTMWRAAFPGTLPLVEKEEITWVRTNYDLGANTAKEATRLAGVWISVELARNFAPSYNLTRTGSRRSTPSRSVKSRKAPSPKPETPGGTSRRSGRVSTLPKTVEEGEIDDGVPQAAAVPDPTEDIAESQSLVQRLKAEYAQPPPAINVVADMTTVVKRTRDEADAPLMFNLEKSIEEIEYVSPSDRVVATNSRVAPRWPTMPTLEANQKAAAWGTLAFALGWGATTFLPQFF